MDEYLRAVTIGERNPLNSTICLAPYDPDWPQQFSLHAKHIRDALSERVLCTKVAGSILEGIRLRRWVTPSRREFLLASQMGA